MAALALLAALCAPALADDITDAMDQARKSQGPPRVVVHPTAS